jgi:hypothetical protein
MATQQSVQRQDGKATLSLVLGILSFAMFGVFAGRPSVGNMLGVLIGILAILLGHFSRSSIKKSPDLLKGKGMALAGLILGYLGAVPPILALIILKIPGD